MCIYSRRILFGEILIKDVRFVEINYRVRSESWKNRVFFNPWIKWMERGGKGKKKNFCRLVTNKISCIFPIGDFQMRYFPLSFFISFISWVKVLLDL